MLMSEWGATLPPFGTLPSQATDAVVDEWCLILARDLTAEIHPPPVVCQWMLARLLCIRSVAAELARTAPGERLTLDAKLMEQFLIAEWHGRLRSLWPKIHAPS